VQSIEVKILNPSREGKKLLVLDIDYTLFDHRSVAETGYELMRPFLHEFLTAAYEVSRFVPEVGLDFNLFNAGLRYCDLVGDQHEVDRREDEAARSHQ
jgi:hypothetical protein